VFHHEDIEYGPLLGKGGEGIVQQCRVIYNDLPVDAAVKTVLNNSDDALTITLDEIELLWYVSPKSLRAVFAVVFVFGIRNYALCLGAAVCINNSDTRMIFIVVSSIGQAIARVHLSHLNECVLARGCCQFVAPNSTFGQTEIRRRLLITGQ